MHVALACCMLHACCMYVVCMLYVTYVACMFTYVLHACYILLCKFPAVVYNWSNTCSCCLYVCMLFSCFMYVFFMLYACFLHAIYVKCTCFMQDMSYLMLHAWYLHCVCVYMLHVRMLQLWCSWQIHLLTLQMSWARRTFPWRLRARSMGQSRLTAMVPPPPPPASPCWKCGSFPPSMPTIPTPATTQTSLSPITCTSTPPHSSTTDRSHSQRWVVW